MVDERGMPPELRAARAAFRRQLGFRPDTRMDEIIFPDGTVLRELPNGTFVGVRRGRGEPPWETLRWML
jgi:hypothetical protein